MSVLPLMIGVAFAPRKFEGTSFVFDLIMVLRDLRLQGLIKDPPNHKANRSIPNHSSFETGAKHFLWCSSETGHSQPNG